MKTQKLSKAKELLFLLMCCAMILLTSIGNAQTTCATSTTLTPTTSCSLTDYQLAGSDTVRWFSFVADSQRVFIDVEAPVLSTPAAHIHALDLYGGSCGSPTLLASRDINTGDSTFSQNAILKIDYSGLTIGLTYYIRVARRTPANCVQSTCTNTSAYFSMCVKNTSLVWFCNWPGTYNCGENIGNGSFEYLDPTWNGGCPFDLTQQGDPIIACPWDGMPMPAFVTATPDFFNSCANPTTPDVGTATNAFGTQVPRTGVGYAGMYTFVNRPPANGGVVKEGLLQTFITPLTVGKVYYEEMFVSLADISDLGTCIGFTSFPTGNANDYYSPVITNKTVWTQVSHCFTANGTETNRAISIYGAPSTLTPVALSSDPGYTLSNPQWPSAYFYIEDVSVRPLAYAGPSITTCNFNATIGCTALPPISGATYSWAVAGPSGVTIVSPTSQSTNATFTTAGTYTFTITTTVTTLAGTCSDTDVMTVTVNGFSSVINTSTSTICYPGSANLSVTNTPSTGPFTYLWTPSTGLSSTTINNPVATPTVTTSYTVTVVNTATGCTNTTAITLTVAPTPIATITGVQTNNCGAGTLAYNAPGVSGVTYTWSVSGGTGSPLTGNVCNVNWTSTGGTITLTATLGSCSTVTALAIPPCCDYPTPYKITNTTASAVLAMGAFTPMIVSGNIIDGSLMPFPTGDPMLITGVFTIDVDITFKNCPFLDFGINSQVQILAGKTLTLDNSKNDQKCAYMWDGIYINGSTAIFKMKNGSILTQAKNTVVSIGGGQYGISNSSLIDDVKGIQVLPYAGTHTGNIVKSTIKMQGTFLPAFPALAAGTNKTLIGIEVNSVTSLNIGDATASGTTNLFDNLYLGIKANNSSLNIVNNKFQNILPLASPSPCCLTSCTNSFFCSPYAMAIFITGGVPSSNFSASIGGAGTYQPNVFSNCGSGIRTEGSINLNINKNDFTISTAASSNGIGILIQNNNSNLSATGAHTVMIQNNTFHAFKTAVSMRYATNTKTDIRNNIITSGTPSVISNGIKVQDMNGSNFGGYTNIQGNAITDVWYGIIGVQDKNLNINKGLQPTANVIKLSSTVTSAATTLNGILVQSCTNTFVSSNTIEKVGGIASAASSSFWIGIRMDNSPAIMVDKNTIKNTGSGIYCYQSSPSSSLACNTFDVCYYGVKFFAANVGDQLGSTLANQNKWLVPPPSFLLTGALVTSTKWYYNLTYTGTNPTPQNAAMLTTLLTGSTDICPYVPSIAPTPSLANRQLLFQKIAYDSLQFTVDTVENRYACRLYAYRQFRNDSTWLNLSDPSDTIYQAFYDSIYNTDVETMAQVEDYIYAGDIVNGVSLNNSIITGTELIANRQVANDIYLNTVSEGIFEYSPTDSATLYAIAIKNPLLGGDGVYRARVMLDMLVFDTNGVGMRTRPVDQALSYPVGKVYPNPNTGTMQLDYTLLEKETGELVLYDLSGKKIRTYTLSEGHNTLLINEGGLAEGVYMYTILINGEIKLTDKVVIIK
ncbi:MAG: T9SS type A sorting domain-containing protein [Bacteroidia bacterium]